MRRTPYIVGAAAGILLLTVLSLALCFITSARRRDVPSVTPDLALFSG